MLPRVAPIGAPGAMPYWDIASEGTNGIEVGLPLLRTGQAEARTALNFAGLQN